MSVPSKDTMTDTGPAGLRLRPMERGDLGQVVAIEAASFTAPWSRETFERLLLRDTAGMVVAEEEGRVVGYAVFWVVGREAELGNLAVHPEARRRGVGRRLIRRVRGEARRLGVQAIYLEVRESNEAARALYQAEEFRNVGRRRGYYRSPSEDALVLRWPLADTSAPGSRRPAER